MRFEILLVNWKENQVNEKYYAETIEEKVIQ